MHKNTMLVLIFSFIFLLLVCVTTGLTYLVQEKDQTLFAQRLLTYSESVTTQLKSVLDDANRTIDPQCNTDNLNKIRRLVQLNPNVYDMGVIISDQVVCSANWGKIEPTVLSSKDITAYEDFRFYSDEQNLYDIDEVYNVTIQKHFFTVNITTSHVQNIYEPPSFQFELVSTIKPHVFEHYSPANFNKSILGLYLKTKTCSELYSYCLNTYTPNGGLGWYTPKIQLIFFIVFVCLSWLTTYLINILMERNKSIEARFRLALKQKTIYMEYQPVIRVIDEMIVSVESLVRWEDAIYGKISPEFFIGIAEKLSLYPQLAYFTAETSLRELSPFLNKSRDFSVGINVETFEVQDKEFLIFLHNLTLELNIEPSQVKIEITERIELDLKILADFSYRARSLGFVVVLDDFGTGVSNLVWLTEINFDYVKVDRLFVNALNYDVKKSMVTPIMELLTNLNREVIFEGVETDVEYQIIKDNCASGYVQGWYFYKSMKLDSLRALLTSQNSTL